MGKPQDRASSRQDWFRRIPKVDAVVSHPELARVRARLGGPATTRLARELIGAIRRGVRRGEPPLGVDEAARRVAARAQELLGRRARAVINAAGVVVHTNLGRAPLSTDAVEALAASAGRYLSLEVDLAAGRRGPRGAFAETALAELSGSEDALVVNNNAAAVLLVLTAIAQGRGVVVSRGEQVEIGGGFRIPEVLARSGAQMIEVGTTNRTRLADYARALDEHADVAVFLRVHQANFRQIGFVERPPLDELARLAHDRGVTLVKDLGGGALWDVEAHGLAGEPTVSACVRAGADLVCFSCDKVLGGPQGGAVVGSAELVGRARRDPLARAVRLGRLPLVALEATLAAYLEGRPADVPVAAMVMAPQEQVRTRVEGWCQRLQANGVAARPVDVEAAFGGGALAEIPLSSTAALIETDDVDGLAARLRQGPLPVLCRISDDQVLLDGRTVLPDEDEPLLEAVVRAAKTERER